MSTVKINLLGETTYQAPALAFSLIYIQARTAFENRPLFDTASVVFTVLLWSVQIC